VVLLLLLLMMMKSHCSRRYYGNLLQCIFTLLIFAADCCVERPSFAVTQTLFSLSPSLPLRVYVCLIQAVLLPFVRVGSAQPPKLCHKTARYSCAVRYDS